MILWSSYKTLAWVGLEPTTTEFHSDALTDWAIDKHGDWQRQTAEMKSEVEQTMKLEQLQKVHSECELKSWPDSLVGWSMWTKFSGRGFKSHSGQLSKGTWKIPSVVNTICITSFHYTHVITYRKLQLKWTWRATKANSRNEMWHWTNDEIGAAVESLLWVSVQVMAW